MSHTGLNRVYTAGGEFGGGQYRGWPLPEDPTGNGFKCSYDIYQSNQPGYGNEQIGTPILFDTKEKVIVSNDNTQITIILNGAFNAWATNPELNLWPSELQEGIDEAKGIIQRGICEGVYRSKHGHKTKNDDFLTAAIDDMNKAFRFAEESLGKSEFVVGDQLTIADVRLFAHTIRFDVIYYDLMVERHRKTAKIKDAYPSLLAWLKRLFSMPAIAQTCDIQVALRGYYNQFATTVEAECDKLYAERRYEWMPDITALTEKRTQENYPIAAMQICTASML